jgi:hypothetical protein
MAIIVLSKESICNLALSRLGSYGGVTDIDNPKLPAEIACAKWWDVVRRYALKELAPNFALDRSNIAADATAPAFGYSYRYRKPASCLKVLGFGEIRDKKNNFTVEGEYILTDDASGEALQLRFVTDIEDVSKWYPEFITEFSFILGYYVNMEITQDLGKQSSLEQLLPLKKAEASALSGQENRPIRITESKFKKARYDSSPSNSEKM